MTAPRSDAALKSGVAKSEYDRGYKAKHYRYGIMQQARRDVPGVYRDTNSCELV